MTDTLQARRLAWVADAAQQVGAKVTVTDNEDGIRSVYVKGPSVFDNVAVLFSFRTNSYTGRDKLMCTVHDRKAYPKKGYATVSYAAACSKIETYCKDYTTHTHCRLDQHVCKEAS